MYKDHSGEILASGVEILRLLPERSKGKYNYLQYEMKCPVCGELFIGQYSTKRKCCGKKECHKPMGKYGRINIGDKFGLLTVTAKLKGYNGSFRYECVCVCGNVVTYNEGRLNNGMGTSCGCSNYGSRIDITGQRYGRLVAIRDIGQTNHKTRLWLFQCDCGNTVETNITTVITGNKRSCGCLMRETSRKSMKNMSQEKKDLVRAIVHVDGTSLSALNSKRPITNTSGHKGVAKTSSGKWRAFISFKQKQFHLGSYDNIEDAINARKIGEEEIWGPTVKKHLGVSIHDDSQNIKEALLKKIRKALDKS